MKTRMLENESFSEKFTKGEKLLRELIEIVRQCQQRFGGKKEIATEEEELVISLCGNWEDVLYYGLKIANTSLFKNVQEIVYGSNDIGLWEFCQSHLTKHEQERFNSLENISTKRGKLRALIRASLNERSLERYLYMWLGDPSLTKLYEPWALMLSAEAANLLPSIAAGLASILFATTIDSKSLDVVKPFKKEPVIFAPAPAAPKKRTIPVKRHIWSTDECESGYGGSLSSDSKEIEKEMNLACEEDELANSSVLPINDKIHNIQHDNDILTFPEDFIEDEDILENIIPENGTKRKSVSISSDISSIQSSSSLLSEQNPNKLENKLKDTLDRCAFLEARVAELSLENRRLHRLLGYDCNKTENYSVTIPRVSAKNLGRRKFHVYQININFNNGKDILLLEKRYSEFYKLHQNVKRQSEFAGALDFPPKKFGSLSSTFVEERRQRLQIYLRHLLALLPETSSCKTKEALQMAFPFLRE